MTKLMLTPVAIAIGVAMSAGASAQQLLPSKTVSVGKLNLSKGEDVAKLKRRLTFAAAYVCTHDALGRFVGPPAHDRAICIEEALASATPSVDALVASATTGRKFLPGRMAMPDTQLAANPAPRP